MKSTKVLSAAMLFLLPVAIGPAYAGGQREQEKAPEQKQEQAKPAQQSQHAEQQKAKPAQQPQRAAQQKEAKPAQQPQRAAQQKQATPAQQPQRTQAAQATNRAQPASSHGRIPDARYRASFGSGHTFHVNRANFTGGSGRFQYGGFSFAMVDPWPVAWLYTDSVYVDYMNGGYFLCDPVHPGVYLSINIG